jgi:hypothetical protein
MNLTKEEIQFIDTYLLKSEVFYVDIRQEMIDHVATAVEAMMAEEGLDFYDAFKAYMVVHKKELLKNNVIRWKFSWDVIRQFGLFLIKPFQLVLAVVLFFLFRLVDINRYFSDGFTVANLFFVLVLSLAVFQLCYFQLYLKKRFYVIEKTGSLLMILYYMQLFFMPFFDKAAVSSTTVTVFSFLYLAYLSFFAQALVRFNQHRLNYI